jgi:FkbH-like protein
MTPEPVTGDSDRAEFLDALATGRVTHAMRAARRLLKPRPRLHDLSFVRKAVAKTTHAAGIAPVRIAILSSFSIEFLHDSFEALAFLDGLRLEIYQAGFAQFRQDILDSASGLYAFEPSVVILAVEGRDLIPQLYGGRYEGPGEKADATVAAARDELVGLIRTFRERSKAVLLVHNFAPPRWRTLGILDAYVGRGQAQYVNELNDALYVASRQMPGVYVVDYAGLVMRYGAVNWYDTRMEHYARAPIAQAHLPDLAGEYLKFCRALAGRTKKCLVLDLDNTLWGGVLGEDGVQGIKLGPTYPGSAFMALQEAILSLHRRGVLLAIASRNNPADVDEVFADHPHMLLKREHFAAEQIHWGTKSDSLRAIAQKLSIGLEHIVFVDDNPVECEQVASELPMVTVIHLPTRPEQFVDTLTLDGLFDSLSLSEEDRRRGDLYKQRDQAEELRERSTSLEDFYARLQMEVVFAYVQPASLARASQLTQKTNQFNVTTFRYGEAEITARMNDPSWLVTTVQVRDVFGDNGIVGFVMAQATGDRAEIDTLLLSCRVIGRGVETAMLAYLGAWARSREVRWLHGKIILTAKNQPARGLYDSHGFRRVGDGENGELCWILDLKETSIEYPSWFRIVGASA